MSVNTAKRHTRTVSVLVVVLVVGAGMWSLPHIFRERETVRDTDVVLGSEKAHVTVIWSGARGLVDSPNGPLIGGGNWRYDTTVIFTSGEKFDFTTELQPRTLWKVGDQLFVACNDGGKWLIAKVSDGQMNPMARSALPEFPSSWNLEPPEQQSEWQQSFDTWAK